MKRFLSVNLSVAFVNLPLLWPSRWLFLVTLQAFIGPEASFACWNKSSRIIHKSGPEAYGYVFPALLKCICLIYDPRLSKGISCLGIKSDIPLPYVFPHAFSFILAAVYITRARHVGRNPTWSQLKLRNQKALLWKAQYWLSFAIHDSFPRKNTLLFDIYLSFLGRMLCWTHSVLF